MNCCCCCCNCAARAAAATERTYQDARVRALYGAILFDPELTNEKKVGLIKASWEISDGVRPSQVHVPVADAPPLPRRRAGKRG